MKNILYSRCIKPASMSEDGETPSMLYLCQENNGYFVYLVTYDDFFILHFNRYSRELALEFAIDNRYLTEEELIKLAYKKG